MVLRFLLLWFCLALPAPVQAQAQDSGGLTGVIERSLSAEGREVRFSGVTGLLSAKARIEEITVADREGIWLRIGGASIDWQRGALLRGALVVNSIAAERLEMLRRPGLDPDLPAPEARALQLPELPVSVEIGSFRLEDARFAQGVFGLAAVLSASGEVHIDDSGLSLAFDARRKDAGGELGGTLLWPRDGALDLRFRGTEPANGVLANLMNLPGLPATTLTLRGTGPVGAMDLFLGLDTGERRILAGNVFLRARGGGTEFSADFKGLPDGLLTGDALALFGDKLSGRLSGRRESGTWQVERLELAGRDLAAAFAGESGASGITGEISLSAGDLARLGALTGLAGLGGSGEFRAQGRLRPADLSFDLTVEGRAQGLSADLGTVQLRGGLSRDGEGLRARGLTVESALGQARLDGLLSSAATVLTAAFSGTYAGLDLSGSAGLRGPIAALQLDAAARVNGPELLPETAVTIHGAIGEAGLAGAVEAGGLLAGQSLALSAELAAGGGSAALTSIEGSWAGAVLSGALRLEEAGPVLDLALAAEEPASAFASFWPGAANLPLRGLTARLEGAATAPVFAADAWLASGSRISLAGRIGAEGAVLERAELTGAAPMVSLARPVALASGAKIGLSSGQGAAEIVIGDQGFARIQDFPLDVLDHVRPLGAAGVVSGRIALTAPFAFDLAASDVTHAATRLTGAMAEMAGEIRGAAIVLSRVRIGRPGLVLTGSGTLPLAGPGLDLALAATLDDAAVLGPLLPEGLGLTGRGSAEARATGSLADPLVSGRARGEGLATSGLQASGLAGFSAETEFSASRDGLNFSDLLLRGPPGFGASGSGRVGPDLLDLALSGRLPLTLAGGLLAASGWAASGSADFALEASGRPVAPVLSGTFALAGASLASQRLNLRLDALSLQGRFDRNRLVLTSGSANSASGGAVEFGGSIGFGREITPDLDLALRDFAWTDGRAISTRAGGSLKLDGGLSALRLSGRLELDGAQILLRSARKGAGGGLRNLRHAGAGAGVLATIERAGGGTEGADAAPGGGLMVDLVVEAPGRVFIRGRGLDAEMKGTIHLNGPARDLRADGGFEMIRGRLNLLGQRFDFTEGRVGMAGALDPVLAFRAETSAGGDAVQVSVGGRASAPVFSLSSSSGLPEDEVLARLIFGRVSGDLSPLQLLRLSAAINELRGGESGVFNQLRKATGLDDLDVTNTEDGSALVRAGKYLDENVYLEIENRSGAEAGSRATINLDLAEGITARAFSDSTGEAGVGVFYERDY